MPVSEISHSFERWTATNLAVSQQCIPFLTRELLALVEELCIDGGGPHRTVFGVLHGGGHVVDFPDTEFFESCLDG